MFVSDVLVVRLNFKSQMILASCFLSSLNVMKKVSEGLELELSGKALAQHE
jgi:hypothetical protein